MPADIASARSAEERLRWLEAVTDAGLAQLTVDQLLDELLEKVRELMAVDTAAVLLLDPSRRFLIATAARGLEEEVHQGVRIPLGRGFAGRIAEEQHWVAIDHVDRTTVLNPTASSSWFVNEETVLPATMGSPSGAVTDRRPAGPWQTAAITPPRA